MYFFSLVRRSGMPRMQRSHLFGMDVDLIRIQEAVEKMASWIRTRDGQMRYVVTPNVQHALLFQQHAELREAYRHAAMVLIDGFPLVWTARLFGAPVPERVAGSDLVPALFARAGAAQRFSVFLLGAAPGVADRAARAVVERYPNVRVVGTLSPPLGFEHDASQNQSILECLRDAAPDVLVLGLGAPKQELWAYRAREKLGVPVVLCAGATIDFLAGEKVRAPEWMQHSGLEWMHRVLTEPTRLGPRYAKDALHFPGLVLREWRQRRRNS